MEPVVREKRGEGCGRMLRVIVGEFCQREEAGPVGLLVVAVHSQVLLQHRVQPLRLPIRLRVESRRPVGPNPTQLQETPPEVRGKHRIPVAHQGFGQAVNPDHVLQEQGRHVGGSHGFGGRNEDCLLRQAVDDHQHRVVVEARRQVRNPVQRHAEPGPDGDREGGQQAIGRMANNLVALAGVAAADVPLHCGGQTRPLKVLLNEGLRPGHIIVPRQR